MHTRLGRVYRFWRNFSFDLRKSKEFENGDYFSYFEDTDYCLKAISAGFRVVNCGDLTILHREHGSTDANNLKTNETRFVFP